MLDKATLEKPRWLRDLLRFLPLKSQFVLSGNVRDLQAREVATRVVAAVAFNTALGVELREAGYAQIVIWEPLAGFRVLDTTGAAGPDRRLRLAPGRTQRCADARRTPVVQP